MLASYCDYIPKVKSTFTLSSNIQAARSTAYNFGTKLVASNRLAMQYIACHAASSKCYFQEKKPLKIELSQGHAKRLECSHGSFEIEMKPVLRDFTKLSNNLPVFILDLHILD